MTRGFFATRYGILSPRIWSLSLFLIRYITYPGRLTIICHCQAGDIYIHALQSAGYSIRSTLCRAPTPCIFILSNHLEIISRCCPRPFGMAIKSNGSVYVESDFVCRSLLVRSSLASLVCDAMILPAPLATASGQCTYYYPFASGA